MRFLVPGVRAEPFGVQIFNELADGQLPALLRSRTQSRELLRIHAERACHFDLSTIESADLLGVRPLLIGVLSGRIRHGCNLARSVAAALRTPLVARV